ncbi:MAG: DUF3494 domain-containing protein [Pyrinomonadaceae bacterium]|nr:DUF3494 domain-containing protein [Sphingobacteriaceae bacterium]
MIKNNFLLTNTTRAFTSRPYSKLYHILGSLLLLMAVITSGCKKDSFTGEIIGLCPVVVSTDPANLAVDVTLPKVITATFNTDMAPLTINKTTFKIAQGSTEISGTVAPTASGKTFSFTPDVPLLPFTMYTGTITTGAKDTLRTAMVADYVWTFTTIPQLSLSSSPPAGGTTSGAGLFAQGSTVTATATANPGFVFTNWTNNGTVVSGNASYQFAMDGNRALVANFSPVAAGTFAVILSSNPIAGGSTLGSGLYSPGTSVNISASANIGYTFTGWSGDASGTANPLTILVNSNKNIVANFTPIVGGGVGVVPGVGPAPVNLGTAGNFTILTKSGITNVFQSAITGNIGTSPISGAAITGLSCPEVSGIIYTVDAAGPACRVISKTLVDNAVSDMETAYTTANGLTTPAPVVGFAAGNLNGQTLPPGLYKWATGVSITTEITLSGGANDTWVFQIAQDLTVNNSAIIKLIGGAQAKNIVWVVAGQSVLGTNVDFSGVILSKELISLNTNAKVTGRLLSQKQVTLIKNTVIQP